MPADPLLPAYQAALRLGVQPTTLRQWRFRSKGPPYTTICGRVKYRQSDLDRWVAENRTDPKKTRPLRP